MTVTQIGVLGRGGQARSRANYTQNLSGACKLLIPNGGEGGIRPTTTPGICNFQILGSARRHECHGCQGCLSDLARRLVLD